MIPELLLRRTTSYKALHVYPMVSHGIVIQHHHAWDYFAVRYKLTGKALYETYIVHVAFFN